MPKKKRFIWKNEHTEKLHELFPTHSAQEIADEIGCGIGTIYKKSSFYGLKKTTEWIADRARMRILENPDHGAWKTTFKKGDEPFNKGKKISEYLSPEGVEQFRKKSYQKGNIPHTHLPGTGHISKRVDSQGIPYLFIKVADADWRHYSNYLWEKENGPIPEGYVITFKDSNTMNCILENLECITKGENLRRNRYNITQDWDKHQAKRAINHQLRKLKKIQL